MPWFKVDDRLYSHPKLAALEAGKHFAEAVALWCIAGSWCASQLTDGVVPTAQLRRLVPFDARKAAAELVRVRLWEEAEDGYRFRAWDEYQPSRESVVTRRQKTAAKVASWRDRNQVTEQSRNPVTSSDVTTPVTLPPTRPDPTRPVEIASRSLASTRDRSPLGARAEKLRKGYLSRFEAMFPSLKPLAVTQPMSGGPWLDLARELEDSQCTPFLDAFFADDDPFVAKDRAPSKLLSQRVRLLASIAGPSEPPMSDLERAFRDASRAAQEAVQRGADAQTQFDLDQAEEAARRALAASRRAS